MDNKIRKSIKMLNISANKYQQMIIQRHGKLIDDAELCTLSGYRKAWQSYLALGGNRSMIN